MVTEKIPNLLGKQCLLQMKFAARISDEQKLKLKPGLIIVLRAISMQ